MQNTTEVALAIAKSTQQEVPTAIVQQPLLNAQLILHQVGTINRVLIQFDWRNITIVPHIARIAH